MSYDIRRSPMNERRCICEHEPHDGKCPERVSTIAGSISCGCDEYCPENNSCYCGEPHPDTPEHDDKACIHCEALCRQSANSLVDVREK